MAGVDIHHTAKTLASIFAYGRKNSWVSHKLAEHWLQILERLHAIFRVPPFGAAKIRAVKKERKHYHLDWTLVPENGPRFENLVACHLAKWVEFEQDVKGRDVELRYFRDVDGRWGGRDLADFESVEYPWIFSLLQGARSSRFRSPNS